MGRLCPVCFSRFIDYEGDELEEHIIKAHPPEVIKEAYHDMQYYVGFLEMIIREQGISLVRNH